jgi:SnoaL-like domain
MDGIVDEIVRGLLDHREISELIDRYGLMADTRAFGDARSCFTDDVIAEYPSGHTGGIDALRDHGRRILGAFARTQHVITNHVIDLSGDRATVRANLIAIHVPDGERPNAHFDAGCTYLFEVARTPEGWRISRLRLEVLWTAGDDDRGLVSDPG